MRLSCIEPAAPGYDIRTFECTKCDSSECFRSPSKRDFYVCLARCRFRIYLHSECMRPSWIAASLRAPLAVGIVS